MPIKQGYITSNGIRMGYYQYGDKNKYKYIINNEKSRNQAYELAKLQRTAIKASQNNKNRYY